MTATLVYDGDCAFCTSSARWMLRLGLRVDGVVPWQHADLERLGLTPAQCQQSVQLVEQGRTSSGHEALARLLLRSAPPWRALGLLLLTPPFSWAARTAYRWVADHRHRLPGGTPSCRADDRP